MPPRKSIAPPEDEPPYSDSDPPNSEDSESLLPEPPRYPPSNVERISPEEDDGVLSYPPNSEPNGELVVPPVAI